MYSGSLENQVEQLVKRWEMEMTYLNDFNDVTSVDRQMFKMKVNDEEETIGEEVFNLGACPAAARGCPFSNKGASFLQ